VNATQESRSRLVKALFEGVTEVGSAQDDVTEAGILRSVEMFLYGNEELSPLDRERTEGLFPMLLMRSPGLPRIRSTANGTWAPALATFRSIT
jgi:hypothetical protein